MDGLKTTNSIIPKDTGNTSEQCEQFIGFDNCDDVLTVIDNKRKSVKIMLKEKEGLNTDLQSNSPSNINHVKKRKKSVVSSPETNDVRNSSRSVSKKSKKDILQFSPSNDSVETNVQPSLELTTPTFNLTSTPRSRGRKINVDISDPIFKLPFDHGWKRELVYRTMGDTNRTTTRSGDVYYYSPDNRKLRSLREIQEHLDYSPSFPRITIDSFTFLKQPIGLNDKSKELIREAGNKSSKEDSFFSPAVKSKRSKTPVRPPYDYELSDAESNKSPNKMKVVFKSVKKPTKSKSKQDKNISEAIDSSLSTPEYTNEDTFSIQPSEASKVFSPLKTEDFEKNTSVIERRNAEINGSLKEMPVPTISMQSVNYMVKSLRHIFKYLKVQELLSASQVCSAWNIVAMHKDLWKNVRLKNSRVYNWDKFADTIDSQCSVSLDTRRMLIPPTIPEFENFWLCFAIALKKAKKLKVIELYRCPPHVVEDIIYSLPELAVLNATSIKNPNYSKETKNPVDVMTLNLNYLGQMSNLTEIRLKGLTGMNLTALPSFEKLVNLKTLSLTSVKIFPKDFNHCFQSITTDLEYLEIGDCDCLTKGFAGVLNRFENLTSLRLENCCGTFDSVAQDIFQEIRNLKKLNLLELINIGFSSTVEEELEKCDGINALLIIPAYVCQSATTNCHLIDCLKKLSKTLTHVVWGITNELLRVTDLFITQYQENQHSIGYSLELSNTKEPGNNIPILRTRKPREEVQLQLTSEKDQDKSNNVDILSVTALEKLLETMMINAKTKVIKIPFSSTTRVYLAEQFKDL